MALVWGSSNSCSILLMCLGAICFSKKNVRNEQKNLHNGGTPATTHTKTERHCCLVAIRFTTLPSAGQDVATFLLIQLPGHGCRRLGFGVLQFLVTSDDGFDREWMLFALLPVDLWLNERLGSGR